MLEGTRSKLALHALTGIGITTAIFQGIGFMRWIFMMPYLNEAYHTQPDAKALVTIVYEMMNHYAGMSIGEHLGFIAMGSWTLLLGIIPINHAQFKRWLGYVGLLTDTLNFIANVLWSIWLVAVAVSIGLVEPGVAGPR